MKCIKNRKPMQCGNFESRLLNGDYGYSLICVNTHASQLQVYPVDVLSRVGKFYNGVSHVVISFISFSLYSVSASWTPFWYYTLTCSIFVFIFFFFLFLWVPLNLQLCSAAGVCQTRRQTDRAKINLINDDFCCIFRSIYRFLNFSLRPVQVFLLSLFHSHSLHLF